MNPQDQNPIFQQWLAAYLDHLVQVLRGCPASETIAGQSPAQGSGAMPEVTQK